MTQEESVIGEQSVAQSAVSATTPAIQEEQSVIGEQSVAQSAVSATTPAIQEEQSVIPEQSVAQSGLVLQSVNCTETPVRPSSSSRQKSIVHVESISPLPRADKQERKRQAKTSHAAELTSSPYKRALEATKAQASASRPRGKKRDAKKVLDVKAKQKKLSKRVNCTEKQKSKSSKPKSVKKTSTCPQCKFVYADPNDPKADEDWIRCKKCRVWFHDSCAEHNGVLDDDGFFCRKCA